MTALAGICGLGLGAATHRATNDEHGCLVVVQNKEVDTVQTISMPPRAVLLKPLCSHTTGPHSDEPMVLLESPDYWHWFGDEVAVSQGPYLEMVVQHTGCRSLPSEP